MVLKRLASAWLVLALFAAAPAASAGQTPAPTPVPVPVPDPADPFFDDTVVHDIQLAINPRDWNALKVHFKENTYYPADMTWKGQKIRNVGIRSRGLGSRSGDKPGLRVDIDYYNKGQKFLGLKSFILRNQTQDASNVRERASMLFFRRMGLKAVREAHARLFVSGVYSGLYTIVESQDKDFLQKNLGENNGHLYEFSFDVEAANAGAAPFAFQYLGEDPSLYVPSPFKPETKEDDPQGEVIERWIKAVNDTTSAWRTSMAEFLDLALFIRHLAVENFLGEEDGITGDYAPNNFFLYRFANTNRFRFLPWDKSNTFWENANYSIFRNINDGPEEKRNKLVLRAFQENDLRNLYLDTLLECAASAEEGLVPASEDGGEGTPGFLEQEVVREYQQIRTAALTDTFKPFTNEEFEQAIEDVKAFARGRSAAVRQQVAAARP